MNALISDFLMFCRFLDLDPDGLHIDRAMAADSRTDPIYAEAVAYLGDAFCDVVAHAWAASWKLDPHNPDGAPELAGMVVPTWCQMVKECPALLAFWPQWTPHEVQDGMIVLKAA